MASDLTALRDLVERARRGDPTATEFFERQKAEQAARLEQPGLPGALARASGPLAEAFGAVARTDLGVSQENVAAYAATAPFRFLVRNGAGLAAGLVKGMGPLAVTVADFHPIYRAIRFGLGEPLSSRAHPEMVALTERIEEEFVQNGGSSAAVMAGEYLPYLGTGMAAAGIGSKIALRAVPAAAEWTSGRLAALAAGRLAGSPFAAQLPKTAEALAKLAQGGSNVLAKAATATRGTEYLRGMPIAQRLAWHAGANAGFTGVDFLYHVGQEGTINEQVLWDTGQTAAWGLMFDGVVVGLGKAFRVGRALSKEAVAKQEALLVEQEALNAAMVAGDTATAERILMEKQGLAIPTAARTPAGEAVIGGAALGVRGIERLVKLAEEGTNAYKGADIVTPLVLGQTIPKAMREFLTEGIGQIKAFKEGGFLTTEQANRLLVKEFMEVTKEFRHADDTLVEQGISVASGLGMVSRKATPSKTLQKIMGEIRAAESDVFEARRVIQAADHYDEVVPLYSRMLGSQPYSARNLLNMATAKVGAVQDKIERELLDVAKGGGTRAGVWAKNLPSLMAHSAEKAYYGLYQGYLNHWLLKAGKSPEGMAQTFGAPGLKILRLAQEVEVRQRFGRAWFKGHAHNATVNLLEAIDEHRLSQGLKPLTRKQRSEETVLFDMVTLGEEGGPAAVEQAFGRKVAELYQREVQDAIITPLGKGLEEMAVNVPYGQAELRANGVHIYFPQVLRRNLPPEFFQTEAGKAAYRAAAAGEGVGGVGGALRGLFGGNARAVAAAHASGTTMEGVLVKAGYNPYRAREIIATSEYGEEGILKFGSTDFQRSMPGSTRQKIEKGVPFQTKFSEVLDSYIDAAVIRSEHARAFGPKMERLEALRAAAIHGGADEHQVSEVVGAIALQSFETGWMKRFSNLMTSVQQVTKLTFAVLPNSTQTINDIAMFGPEASMAGITAGIKDARSIGILRQSAEESYKASKGLADAIKTADRDTILQTIGLMEGSLTTARGVWAGEIPKTLMERVARWSLKATGFSQIELTNRMIAAHTALFYARDIGEKVARGALRGENYTAAKRGMAELGLDLDGIAKRFQGGQARFTGEETQLMIQEGVRRTQFTTGPLDVPTMWKTATGRMVTQFKSFAFQQGRFFRDQVLAQAANGNYAPMLYYLGLGSVGGEMVAQAQAFVKGRDREGDKVFGYSVNDHPAFRILDNLMSVGGVGLAMDVGSALYYNRVVGFLAGPAAQDFAKVVDVNTRGEYIQKQPAFRAVAGLYLIGASALEEGWDVLESFAGSEGGGGGTEGLTIEELRQLQRGRKE